MKKYTLTKTFTVLGFIFFLVAAVVGSRVDAQGYLIEPAFFCIPLGYFSLIVAGISAIITYQKNRWARFH
ncbi:DUF3955 domain-containing protein [Enterococcus massiliensis]|uniref:DUF3955 domain-containing protein n=1 Tax=Enterococcus massiliensis TaxID=1640685 RepID=UPI00065E3920|nr:DUF3955 domain-containing protein [Enterococcus massiliensis]